MATQRALVTRGNNVFAEVLDADSIVVGGGVQAAGSNNLNLTPGSGGNVRVVGTGLVLNGSEAGAGSTTTITVDRGSSADVSIRWNETSDIWEYTNNGADFYPLLTGYTHSASPFGTALGEGTAATGAAALNRVLIGYQAGAALTTGDSNTIVGSGAGVSLTTGNRQTIVGYNAGAALTAQTANVTENVIIGSDAVALNDGVYASVAVGHGAGYNNGGFENVFIGYKAAYDSGTTSNGRVAVGNQAGELATGNNSVAIGYQSGRQDTGGKNVYVGYAAASEPTGESNVAVGQEAMHGTSGGTAQHNTAVGYQALYAIDDGTDNIAIGSDALKDISSGSGNVVVGVESGNNLTTGSNNILFGYQTVASAVSSSNEIVIGASLTGKGSNTTFIKNSSLYFGSNLDEDHTIYVDNTDSPAPGLRYDAGNNEWQYSNDGSTWNAMGGGGAGSVTKFDTVANCRAAAAPSVGDICYIEETRTFYEYATTGGVADDGTNWIANTAAGGSSRWVATAGRYGRTGLFRTTTTGGSSYTVVIGKDALRTGDPNAGYASTDSVYIGQNAGLGTEGDFNVVIGSYALDASTGAHSTVAIGYEAASALTSLANNNVYVGHQTAGSRTQGNFCIGIGSLALANAGSGNDVIAIGYQSARYLTPSSSVFVGNYTASSASGAGVSWSVGVGAYALNAITTGDFNTMVGGSAGRYFTTSLYNTGVGYSALGGTSMTASILHTTGIGYNAGLNMTGRYGVAIGSTCMQDATGQYNIGIGYQAGNGIDADQNTICIGYNAGYLGIGSNCIAIGSSAGSNTGSTDDNITIGYRSGSITGANNVCIGTDSCYQSDATTISNVCIGYEAGRSQRGTGSSFVGYQAGYRAISASNYNVGVGYQAMYGGSGFNTAENNIGLGYRSLYAVTTGSHNIAIGGSSLDALTTASELIAIGPRALTSATTSNMIDCIAIGPDSMFTANAPSTTYPSGWYRYNTAVGADTMQYLTVTANDQANDYNTALGYGAMQNTVALAQHNTAVGALSLQASASPVDCTAVGYNALNAATGDYNTAVGATAAVGLTSAQYTVAIGYGAMSGDTVTGSNNVAVGANAGEAITTASGLVYIGYQAGNATDFNCDGNVGVGYRALASAKGAGTTGGTQYNTAVGYQALEDLTVTTSDTQAVYNTALGYQAGLNIAAHAERNTAIGAQALGSGALTGNQNTAIGYQALYGATTSATANTAVGGSSLFSLTTGTYNTALGYLAGYTISTGDFNLALGYNAMNGGTVTGDYNVMAGYAAGSGLTSGQYNVGIGYQAGNAITTGSFCVAIGYNADCTGVSNGTSVGVNASVTTTSGTAIGSNASVTHTNASAIGASASSQANNSITIGGTSVTTVYVNATQVHNISDARHKMRVEQVEAGLAFIREIEPVQFEWKEGCASEDMKDRKVYGFIAQDTLAKLKKYIPKGKKPSMVTNQNEFDGEDKFTMDQTQLIAPLVRAVQELSGQVEALMRRVDALEATG